MPNLHVEPHFNAFSFFVNSFGQFGAERSQIKNIKILFLNVQDGRTSPEIVLLSS